MKYKIKILFLVTYFSFFIQAGAQVNYEPVSNSVYSYLERMSNKGVIQLNEEILPFSRQYIARKLIEINNRKDKISSLEENELDFYIREYSSELKRDGFDLSKYKVKKKIIDLKTDNFGFDKYNRFRIFSFDTNKLGVFLDPVFRYNITGIKDAKSKLWSNGLRLYGRIGKSIGYQLYFYDNHFQGEKAYFKEPLSPDRGYGWYSSRGKGIDFDRMTADLVFSWSWGSFAIGKNYNYFGNGDDGKIILSDRAPSFPQIKLEISPVVWFKFSYIHGLLNSQILDSTTFRFNPQRNHISTVNKFFVTHYLSITPYNYLNVSIGESVIYSDKFQPIYLIPISFFRFSDHYLSDPDENAGNAQIFASVWYKNYFLRTKFYGSIFIDELSISNSDSPQALAYNIGFKSIDPLIPESELVIEYTKVLPFVYSHADSAQTYANYGYEMGHWIGSNADEIYMSFRKRIVRGLNLDFWYRYIRKGNEEDISQPRYQKEHTFLWGEVSYITMYGTSLIYEITHGLLVQAIYEFSNSVGAKKYLVNEGNKLTFGISYGL